MAEPAGYQPRSMFSQMLAQRQNERTQTLVAKTLNEEIEAGIGDQTNVDLAETVPQAYFRAAQRIAALGNATEAQALYQAGIAATESTTKHQATLDNLRASTDNLNEAQTEYLETLRQKNEHEASLANFDPASPTGQALAAKITELSGHLEFLHTRGAAGIPALPREVRLAAQFEADRAANNGQPGMAEKVWQRERMTSSRAQDAAANEEDPDYVPFTLNFQGDLSGSQTLGSEDVKSLVSLEDKAYAARSNLRTVGNSIKFLNEGVRTGPLVDTRQFIARGVAEFLGDDPSQTTVNTDAYNATAGPRILEIARALAPVTELDLTKVEQIVAAGLSNATPESLRAVLTEIGEAQVEVINRYNDRLAALGPNYTNLGSRKPISVPTINFAAPTAPEATKPIAQMSTEEIEAELRSLRGR